MGARACPKAWSPDPDTCTFPKVNTETEYGWTTRCHEGARSSPAPWAPRRSPASQLGAFRHRRGHQRASPWSAARTSAASIRSWSWTPKQGRQVARKWTARREYRRYHEGYGDILVQMNVEDTRLGVAEYVIDKLGVETIELKWGQGAKCIGGEIKVNSLERALELQRRGYIVTPDPSSDPVNQAAFKDGALKQFERPLALGFIDPEGFHGRGGAAAQLGPSASPSRPGPTPCASWPWPSSGPACGIDLLTIDGAPGGTGMSPWRMMVEWGVPTSTCTRHGLRAVPGAGRPRPARARPGLCRRLFQRGPCVQGPGPGRPVHKAVCMGRALMIPGMVGKNKPVMDRHPEYRQEAILKRITEPEKVFMFCVPWVDDQGQVQINRGFRVEHEQRHRPICGRACGSTRPST
jgi:hypothetical protein